MCHYDALVLTLCINGFDVHRVLVDPGSATNLLQLLAFIQMKLSFDILNLAGRILYARRCHTSRESQASHSAGFFLSRRGLGALQCHSGSDLTAP